MQTAGQFLKILFFVVFKEKSYCNEMGRKRMPGINYWKVIKDAGCVELFNL